MKYHLVWLPTGKQEKHHDNADYSYNSSTSRGNTNNGMVNSTAQSRGGPGRLRSYSCSLLVGPIYMLALGLLSIFSPRKAHFYVLAL